MKAKTYVCLALAGPLCLLIALCSHDDFHEDTFDERFVCFKVPDGKRTVFHPQNDSNSSGTAEVCHDKFFDYDGDGVPNVYDGPEGSLAGDYTRFALQASDDFYEIANVYQLQAIQSLQCPPRIPAANSESSNLPSGIIPGSFLIGPEGPSDTLDTSECPLLPERMSANYRFVSDIDLSITQEPSYDGDFDASVLPSGEGFLPIGSLNGAANCSNAIAQCFNGRMIGGGYSLSGMSIDRSTSDDVGLFGVVTSSAQVNEINIVNATVTGYDNVAALIGRNDGINDDRVIRNNNVLNTQTFGNNSVAQIIGNPPWPGDAPQITMGLPSYTLTENNSSWMASYAANQAVAWSLAGTDAADFSIDSSGNLTFNSTPDYEMAADDNTDNVYDITLVASPVGSALPDAMLNVSVRVEDLPLTLNGSTALNVIENTSTSTVIETYTVSPSGESVTWNLTGTDASGFMINSMTGALSFAAVPDHEMAADANTDNTYEFNIVAAETDGSTAFSQTATVTVTNQPLTINGSTSLSFAENTPTTSSLETYSVSVASEPVTWALNGTDAANFNINASNGVLTFGSPPDYETKTSYSITIQAQEGSSVSASLAVAVTVTDIAGPAVTTGNAAVSINENSTGVGSYTASGTGITYSINSCSSCGADGSLFNINAATGALSFSSAPDFEGATKSDDGDNNYEVTIRAQDSTGEYGTDFNITVSVTNVGPAFAAGASDTTTVVENTATVGTYTASSGVTYSINTCSSCGADGGLFSVVSGTGALSFSSAPDFEAATKSDDGDDDYEVTIEADDGTETANIDVTVTVTNEVLTIGGSGASLSVQENTPVTSSAGTYNIGTSTEPVTWALSGTDAADFNINTSSGVLTFVNPPDFETKTSYSITIEAQEGSSVSASLAVTVTITNIVGPAVTTGSAAVSISENNTTVASYTASGTGITYSINSCSSCGADGSLFNINAATGALSFSSAPDFEGATKSDDGDNNYEVTIRAQDSTGEYGSNFNITVSVTDIVGPAIATGNAAVSISENSTAVGSYTASGSGITYSINSCSSCGADGGLFSIDTNTGALSFSTAPDFEGMTKSDDGDNDYQVTIRAQDSTGEYGANFNITVSVTNVGPAFAAGASDTTTVVENSTAVGTYTASGSGVTYSINSCASCGADGGLFSVVSGTGALSFSSARDFEAATKSADGDDDYEVTIEADDGTETANIDVTVTVTNEVLTIGGSGASLSVQENTPVTSSAGTYNIGTSTEPVTWALSGTDAADFNINTSGALTFGSPPDFETKNSYSITIEAREGSSVSASLAVTVTITNIVGPAIATGSAAPSINENSTTVGTYTASGSGVTYSINTDAACTTCGADGGLFSIDTNTGALSFSTAPDFEGMTKSADGDNDYQVTIRAQDSTGEYGANFNITVSVTDIVGPAIATGSAAVSISENNTTVASYTASGSGITYSINSCSSCGADGGLFSIDTNTGALSFSTAPDFEGMTKSDDGDNDYEVTIRAQDSTGEYGANFNITVSVTNVGPAFAAGASDTTTVVENTTAVGTYTASGSGVTYSINTCSSCGADASFFSAASGTGALSFSSAPDFEAATKSADGDDDYEVTIEADDGTETANIDVTVTVTNEVLTIGGSGASLSVQENTPVTSSAGTYNIGTSTEPVTWALSGTDAADFNINTSSGVLTFVNPPDFETKTSYSITIEAQEGSSVSASLAVTVTITNIVGPAIATGSAAPSINENSTTVGTYTASGSGITYSINTDAACTTCGADGGLFSIDTNTGALSFSTAPDFEGMTKSADGDNDYQVTIRAQDSTGEYGANFNITVSVTDVVEVPPSITSPMAATIAGTTSSIDINENTTTVGTYAPSAGAAVSITGGPDETLFTIDTNTGALTFNTNPDFEMPHDLDDPATPAPTDESGDNTYEITLTVTQGSLSDTLDLVINIQDAAGPAITMGSAAPSINENSTAVGSYTASGSSITYEINTDLSCTTCGADGGFFSIDPNTGALSFNSAPDFEYTRDVANAATGAAANNNVYHVTIRSSDSSGEKGPNFYVAITVTDVSDGTPPVILVTSTSMAPSPTIDHIENANRRVEQYTVPSGSTVVLAGVDASRFQYNSGNGRLLFLSIRDFEMPDDLDDPMTSADESGDNIYQVTLEVTNGGNTTGLSLLVTVLNETLTVTGDTSPDFQENTVASTVETYGVSNTGETVTGWSVSGTDSSDFSIDSSGNLTFNSAPDFEAPTDRDDPMTPADESGDNVYQITVTAAEPGGQTTSEDISLMVTDDPIPSFTDLTAMVIVPAGSVSVTINENTNFVRTYQPSSGAAITASGLDSASFTVSAGGGIQFTVASTPDFEMPTDRDDPMTPTDEGGDNVYEVTLTAADSVGEISTLNVMAIINNLPGPTITPPSAATTIGTTSTIAIDENISTVGTYAPSSGATMTVGGLDAGLFSIDTSTGALTFNAAPDFETARDIDDPMTTADEGGNNVYEVTLTAADGVGDPTSLDVEITINNVPTPTITLPSTATTVGTTSTIDINENTLTVGTYAPSTGATIAMSGLDAASFQLDTNTGVLQFNFTNTFPNFENSADRDDPMTPTDEGGNNVYEITLTATHSNGETATLDIEITVKDVAPTITPPSTATTVGTTSTIAINENSTTVGTYALSSNGTYTISGLDAGLFNIAPITEVLSFNTAPDFEMAGDIDDPMTPLPIDEGGDNVYQITLNATDSGGETASLDLEITVNNLPNPSVSNSIGGGAFLEFTSRGVTHNIAIDENTTDIGTYAPSSGATMTVGGLDAAPFTIDTNTGALSFTSAPDFETPGDDDGDNVYEITLTATHSNGETGSLNVKVTVRDFAITGNPTVINAGVTRVGDYTAPGGATVSINGGADSLFFTFSGNTLSFNSVPDMAMPMDSDMDNIYEVTLSATDGTDTANSNLMITFPEPVAMWVTSSTYAGNWGVTNTFDWPCQSDANTPAGYSNHRGFLRDTEANVLAEIQSGGIVRRVVRASDTSVTIIENLADFTDATVNLNSSVRAGSYNTLIWFGATGGTNCNTWTSNLNTFTGRSGNAIFSSGTRIGTLSGGGVINTDCNNTYHLYCVSFDDLPSP